ncbi:hypothetical protein PCASD_07690 [Puccinia coronata f. sp. avenae]|uniref:Uncharacterized protein n=1 Tax=Puccinia coronata f. sp. avenae TaxID=200324 RepID=A0A2N5UP35_9BASI|nr:hypothetical protein PCASD_07690 [Puccinia coronata f. sp. avenae]
MDDKAKLGMCTEWIILLDQQRNQHLHLALCCLAHFMYSDPATPKFASSISVGSLSSDYGVSPSLSSSNSVSWDYHLSSQYSVSPGYSLSPAISSLFGFASPNSCLSDMSFGDNIMPKTGLPPYVLPMVNLAANGPPVSLPEIPPTFLSNGVRVLGLGPPVLFQCSINFTIYCAEKTKQNTTNWVTLKPNSDLSVTFNTHGNPSLGAFRKLIADHCNSEYNLIGKIIQDGTTTEPPTITWDAYILKNKRFPKNSPLALLDDIMFNQ